MGKIDKEVASTEEERLNQIQYVRDRIIGETPKKNTLNFALFMQSVTESMTMKLLRIFMIELY